MADFLWEYTLLDLTTSVDGGVPGFVNIDDTSISLTMSIEGSGIAYNPFVVVDTDLAISVIGGQFVPTYMGRNVVRWSSIDNLDFTLGEANLSGWKALEWEGVAWRGLRFKNSIIVYGSGGISVLFPISDPVSTWSEYVLDMAGILSKDAVCDADTGHLYIGRDYNIYAVAENSQSLKSSAIPVIKLVGYKEFIQELTGNIRIFFEPVTKVIYIAGNNKTLLISEGEVSELDMSLAGAIYTDQLRYAVNSTQGSIVRLVTQDLRFGTTNYKTIRSIAFDIDMPLLTSAVCIIYTRDKTTKLFTVEKRYKITERGIAFPSITVDECRIGIEYVPTTKLATRSMAITVQFSDKRFGYGGADVKQITA